MKSRTRCVPCKGTGRITMEMGRYTARCAVCLGTGKAKPERCPTCKGQGYSEGTCAMCSGLGVLDR